MVGLSPGFQGAAGTSVVPERRALDTRSMGNPGVQIRMIDHAVLREFSIVTAGIYDDALVELRAEELAVVIFNPRSVYQWL